ncbi:DUF1007 family protein [Pseudogemmobacter bohemicus]|uniref:DUF1007 family protein n=1 Tax=Pseudogemmobacter bohemicus TaxID=2250708 RepID=UPI000DD43B23|nr:DUF1007 family protein [Pseudogemmobacter bohemicus]
MLLRLFCLLLFVLPHAAWAHPHEFVETGLTFRFDDQGRPGAVSVDWVYDDLASLLILADLGMDMNGDGMLTGAEAGRLNEMATGWPEDFNGNLSLSPAGRRLTLSLPPEGEAGLHDLLARHLISTT